jgi:hypothetical protein
VRISTTFWYSTNSKGGRNDRRQCAAPNHHCLRLIGVTLGGISTFGFAVVFASNSAGLRNITLHWLQAWKGVS